MSNTLYGYYERELLYIRNEAQQFAAQYPATAGRLLLEPNASIDPHVERLIEAFALLSGRIHKKLDDDFSELTDGLLNVLYPHYLAPIPSLSVVQFDIEPANAKPEGILVDKGTRLHTQRIGGSECRFRTCYPTTLWPLEIRGAQLQTLPLGDGLQPPPGTVAALRLQIDCLGQLRLADLRLDTLRVFLDGADDVVARLYGLIFHNTIGMELRSTDDSTAAQSINLMPRDCLRYVGYERHEGLLPYPPQSFLGYRLLAELFAFPCKFHFVDIAGWEQAARAGFGRRTEIVFYLNETLAGSEHEINTATFRLGCTPIVNLYEKTAEPIKFTHTKTDYRVQPDVHHPLETEVYSIDRVTSADPRSTIRYEPFHGLRHDCQWNPVHDDGAYWYAKRQPSRREGDDGTDVLLHLVNARFEPHMPADAVVIVRTTCTNRDLPVRLQQAGNAIRFQPETSVPVRSIRCVRAPTPPRRPPLGRQAYWRLLSHMTLNYLSITDDGDGLAALQEILRLYDVAESREVTRNPMISQRLVEGITSVRSRRVVGRVDATVPAGFCRGVEVEIELDPHKYVGTGAYLFACVLERFLGMFTSINSFTQLVLRAKGSDCTVKKWPPRAGETQLL